MTVPYFTEAQVGELISLGEVIDALEDVLRREPADSPATAGSSPGLPAAGAATLNIAKSMATWDPSSSAHTLGGADPGAGLVAFKNWVNTPRGATALLTLFDAATGQALAVVEAALLGALRTAATAGLGTRWLAPPDAGELAVLGSGRQALRQVQAMATVRPVTRVRVWSPTEANRARFGETLAEHVDAEVVVADTMDAALAGADLLTTVTRAREPFLGRDELAGVASLHINAMGAVLAHSAEMQPELVEGADVVAVDNLDNARRGSRELTESFGAGLEGVRTLGDLVRSGYRRPASARLTIFKAMGTGLADLAAASVLARNAELEWTTT